MGAGQAIGGEQGREQVLQSPHRQERRAGLLPGRHSQRQQADRAAKLIAPRINGRFTGTTKEILRWAACKWGIDQSIVFAQAAVESWWRQTTKATPGAAWGAGSGGWRTPPAVQYIGKVRQYLREKIWTTPDFQQP